MHQVPDVMVGFHPARMVKVRHNTMLVVEKML